MTSRSMNMEMSSFNVVCVIEYLQRRNEIDTPVSNENNSVPDVYSTRRTTSK